MGNQITVRTLISGAWGENVGDVVLGATPETTDIISQYTRKFGEFNQTTRIGALFGNYMDTDKAMLIVHVQPAQAVFAEKTRFYTQRIVHELPIADYQRYGLETVLNSLPNMEMYEEQPSGSLKTNYEAVPLNAKVLDAEMKKMAGHIQAWIIEALYVGKQLVIDLQPSRFEESWYMNEAKTNRQSRILVHAIASLPEELRELVSFCIPCESQTAALAKKEALLIASLSMVEPVDMLSVKWTDLETKRIVDESKQEELLSLKRLSDRVNNKINSLTILSNMMELKQVLLGAQQNTPLHTEEEKIIDKILKHAQEIKTENILSNEDLSTLFTYKINWTPEAEKKRTQLKDMIDLHLADDRYVMDFILKQIQESMKKNTDEKAILNNYHTIRASIGDRAWKEMDDRFSEELFTLCDKRNQEELIRKINDSQSDTSLTLYTQKLKEVVGDGNWDVEKWITDIASSKKTDSGYADCSKRLLKEYLDKYPEKITQALLTKNKAGSEDFLSLFSDEERTKMADDLYAKKGNLGLLAGSLPVDWFLKQWQSGEYKVRLIELLTDDKNKLTAFWQKASMRDVPESDLKEILAWVLDQKLSDVFYKAKQNDLLAIIAKAFYQKDLEMNAAWMIYQSVKSKDLLRLEDMEEADLHSPVWTNCGIYWKSIEPDSVKILGKVKLSDYSLEEVLQFITRLSSYKYGFEVLKSISPEITTQIKKKGFF